MKVVILAGGKGSRISEITKRIPKPMIQIKNRTILEHIINIYSEQNFNEFIIAIGYKGELIKKYFQKYEIKKNQYKLKGQNKIIRILFIQTGNKTMTGGRLKYVEKYLDKEDKNKGIHVLDIPDDLIKLNHERVSAYYRLKEKSILVGYAITKAGFSIVDQMGSSGSDVIRNMITEQIDNAGIKLSSDENIVVKINPSNDYTINNKHKAIIIR